MFDNGFDFGSLDLSNVKAATAGAVLPPGRYVCTTSDAKVENTKEGGGKYLSVRLKEINGKGVITGRLNLHLPKSAEATRIGLEQLKGLLTCGGHEDPNNVGQLGVSSINGLTVGVIVKGEKYQGEDRSAVSGFCKPSDVKGYESQVPQETGSIGDSDIPF